MKNCLLFPLIWLAGTFAAQGQEKISVSEGSLKIAGFAEENLYFAFAKDDRIIFSFSEADGKEIKEVAVIEYPSSIRYTDFKTTAGNEKTILVNGTGVYRFRFVNGNIRKRVCRYTISRLPASEATRQFNTTVDWVTRTDTTWKTYTREVVTGYDTSFLKLSRKVAVSTTQTEEPVMEKTERVHSLYNSNSNSSWVYFSLPPNISGDYKKRTVVGWAYWVAVGEEAGNAWKKNIETIGKIATNTAGLYTSPLGAFAVGAIAELAVPKVGEDVSYLLVNVSNRDMYINNAAYTSLDKGKGSSVYKKFIHPGDCQGGYYIRLHNDNKMQGIDVTLKIVAITETVIYEDQPYLVPIPKARKETRIFTEPEIHSYQEPLIKQ